MNRLRTAHNRRRSKALKAAGWKWSDPSTGLLRYKMMPSDKLGWRAFRGITVPYRKINAMIAPIQRTTLDGLFEKP